MRTKTTILAIFLAIFTVSFASAQEKEKSKAEIRKEQKAKEKEEQKEKTAALIKSLEFTFVAERMSSTLPGGNRNLTGYYSVDISSDKLYCQLPFYGRMNSVQYNAVNANPLDFYSTDFECTKNERKKDKTLLTFEAEPEDRRGEKRKLAFEIFDSGSASLTVSMSHGDASFFSGSIKPLDK